MCLSFSFICILLMLHRHKTVPFDPKAVKKSKRENNWQRERERKINVSSSKEIKWEQEARKKKCYFKITTISF